MSKAKASGALPLAMIAAQIEVVWGGFYRRPKRKKQLATEAAAEGTADAEILAQMDDRHADSASTVKSLDKWVRFSGTLRPHGVFSYAQASNLMFNF